jgi:homoserine O-acetyltransferase
MIQTSYTDFQPGDTRLSSGQTLSDVRLAFTTFGKLNVSGDNAILVVTHFGGTHSHSQYLIGPELALNPKKYFIVVVNLLGNGMSSSPSDGLRAAFPLVSMRDNVNLQYRLLRESLGIKKLALVTGHSMGGVATYHWAALYPEFVLRAAPICGAARISDHNWVFLEGMRSILTSDPVWNGGDYETQPTQGLKNIARAWAAWPPSAHFYRERLYTVIGYHSLGEYLTNYWEATYLGMDANNILAQIDTWESANISENDLYSGDFEKALASIQAKIYVMPSTSDAYFPVEDSEREVRFIPGAELRPIDSKWGHWAGSGRNIVDTNFINKQLEELLNL